MESMNKRIALLDEAQADIRLTRLAYEIYENNLDEKEIVLAGIRERGYAIANQLKKKLSVIGDIKVSLIAVQMDKDNPIDVTVEPSADWGGRNIVLVDDVANSGRTLLYALKPFLAVIPSRIQVAVLVDRKHKVFPVSSDYIGLQVSTTLQDHIIVEVEKGKVKGAYLR
jgi:pyrimidine operon attenuation protein/uracil phosphoribosyltransferase